MDSAVLEQSVRDNRKREVPQMPRVREATEDLYRFNCQDKKK